MEYSPQKTFSQSIQNHISQHHHITVGLSGGVDSVVLLHLLAQTRAAANFQLAAVHVHHGLNPHADDWAEFCHALCQNWQIPFICKKVQVQSKGLGVEAAARNARYAAYAQLPTTTLALAHHQNDQLETFLLAVLRGGGTRALAGMATQRHSGSLNIIRPLLHHSRTEIERYAQIHALPHITDDSNHDTQFLRNWIRHDWLPPLLAHVPHADRQIIAAVANAQDDLAILDEILAQDWQFTTKNQYFNLKNWQTFSPARRRQLLHHFAKIHQLGTPRRVAVADFERVLMTQPASAEWALPQGKAVAYHGNLFALTKGWEKHLAWHTPLSGSLNDLAQRASLTLTHGYGLPQSFLHQKLTLRCTQKTDTIAMKSGRKSVAKLLQEKHIPPFLRAHYPILMADSECVAVVGLAVNQRVAVTDGYALRWDTPFCAFQAA